MTLLALLCLCAQAVPAEETFRKIEETVQAAESLRVKLKLEAKVRYRAVVQTNAGSGTLLLKKGNRLDFSLQLTLGPTTLESRVLSDGSRLRVWTDGKERGEVATDPALGARMASTLVRGGVSQFGATLPVGAKKDAELSSLLQLSDFREGGSQGTMKSVSFKLKTSNAGELSNEVTLWFDSRTFQPLIRVTTTRTREAEITTTETYEDVAVNVDVPDASFALPPAAPAPKGKDGRPIVKPTRSVDLWEGKPEGTWYRFKRTVSDQELYSDVGLQRREPGCNVVLEQWGEKGKSGPVETLRRDHAGLAIVRQEAVALQGRDYACDVLETAAGERHWVVKEGRYAGAILKSVTPLGLYQAKTVWEHTLKVRGKDFACLVIEAELKLEDKTVPSKTWFCPSVPTHHLRIVSEGDTLDLVDFGDDWSKRPAFPGAPERQT